MERAAAAIEDAQSALVECAIEVPKAEQGKLIAWATGFSTFRGTLVSLAKLYRQRERNA